MKSVLSLLKLRYLLLVGTLYIVAAWLNLSGLATIDASLMMAFRYLVVGVAVGFAIRKSSLTHWIFVAMVIGMAVGYDFPDIAKNLNILSKIFMKLVKCVIAPLLLGTLVTGIAGHSNMKQLGRLGLKALIYFEIVTTFALFIGLAAINFSNAGSGIQRPDNQTMDMPKLAPKTATEIILHIFPENLAKSIADGEVL